MKIIKRTIAVFCMSCPPLGAFEVTIKPDACGLLRGVASFSNFNSESDFIMETLDAT
jgi:hypothetical protein